MREMYKIILLLVLLALAVGAFYGIYRSRQKGLIGVEETIADTEAQIQADETPAATEPLPPKDYHELPVAERETRNTELGLPVDYPCDILPVYEGSDIVETSVDDAESSDGLPMRHWVIRAETDASQQAVYEFYQDLTRELDLAQTLYISKPGAHGVDYGVNYADENFDIRFEIERQRSDTRTRLKIEVFRLVSAD